jgi:hypothetical protein
MQPSGPPQEREYPPEDLLRRFFGQEMSAIEGFALYIVRPPVNSLANPGMIFRQHARVSGYPCSSKTGGPSPASVAAISAPGIPMRSTTAI